MQHTKLSKANSELLARALATQEALIGAFTSLIASLCKKAAEVGDLEKPEFEKSEELEYTLQSITKIGMVLARQNHDLVYMRQRIEDLEARSAELTSLEKADTVKADDNVIMFTDALFAKLNKPKG